MDFSFIYVGSETFNNSKLSHFVSVNIILPHQKGVVFAENSASIVSVIVSVDIILAFM